MRAPAQTAKPENLACMGNHTAYGATAFAAEQTTVLGYPSTWPLEFFTEEDPHIL